MEGGTLMQLRNLVNRRNIGKSKEITKHVNEVEDFLELCTVCYIVAAVMHFFSMSTISDEPRTNGFPENIGQMEYSRRKQLLFKRIETLIEEYVVPREFSSVSEQQQQVQPEAPTGVIAQQSSLSTQSFHSMRVTHEHCYSRPAAQQRHRRLPSSVATAARPHVGLVAKKIAPDGVFNYSSAMLNDGLLLLELKDAIREGDGERVTRCWKVMLLYFRQAGHTNYQKEAFEFLAMVNATASPKIAKQVTWGRFVNTQGGMGKNIPVDLHMEHLNRNLKEYIANLGANVAESGIVQCGKSLSGIMEVVDRYDQETGIHKQSQQHTRPSDSDEGKIIEQLMSSQVFEYSPGRFHKTFRNIRPNITQGMDKAKLFAWIAGQKESAKRRQRFLHAFGHQL